jgi:hypothetical protein
MVSDGNDDQLVTTTRTGYENERASAKGQSTIERKTA